MNWLKKFFLFVALSCLLAGASADIFLVSPLEKQVHANDSIELGSIAPGETLELIFSNKSGKDFSWSKAEIAKQFPEGWVAVDSEPFAESLAIKITVPKDQAETAQNLKISLINLQDEKTNESFNATIFVKKNLISAAIMGLQRETKVNSPVEYILSLSNDSIADHKVKVFSTLPDFWFAEKEILLKQKYSKDSIQEVKLVVSPRAYGNKDFSFIVVSETNGNRIDSFNARLKVNPTLKGKYAAAMYGFPILTPTLFPYYIIESFFSLFQ